MGYVIVGIVCFVAGGAIVWFFKDKTVKLAKKTQTEAEELYEKAKAEVDELKTKVG